MTIGCNIWMICLILIWFFYDPSCMFQLPPFVWALRCSVWDVFINFLLIDATDRSKISSDQKRFFIALSVYPLSFFANTPFNISILLTIAVYRTAHLMSATNFFFNLLCSLFFKIFPSLPKSAMKTWAAAIVCLARYCYSRTRRFIELLFFA